MNSYRAPEKFLTRNRRAVPVEGVALHPQQVTTPCLIGVGNSQNNAVDE